MTTWLWIAAALVFLMALPFLLSGYMKLRTAGRILTFEEASQRDYDCILVLGAGVWGTGEDAVPSHLLEDRLTSAIKLYHMGASGKMLMSGDHSSPEYDEVNVMKKYAVDRGVPSPAVFMDHAGFCTYDTLYRARDVFAVKRVLIVTQKYHEYRAIYVARALGMDAYGVAAVSRKYDRQWYYSLREVFARCKDLFMALFLPRPRYLGDVIPISGDGDVTNDK